MLCRRSKRTKMKVVTTDAIHAPPEGEEEPISSPTLRALIGPLGLEAGTAVFIGHDSRFTSMDTRPVAHDTGESTKYFDLVMSGCRRLPYDSYPSHGMYSLHE